jgi:tetratricopeptide (TPR) repeat protein
MHYSNLRYRIDILRRKVSCMKFFISYSRTVQHKVKEIVESLRNTHDDVWWDRELRAGQDWWGAILEHIETCDIFIFIVSEKSVQSAYCLAELQYALARNRLVLPFVVDAPLTYDLPPEITKGRIQYEMYDGNPESLPNRIHTTCRHIIWGQYQDRYASRPAEPNTGTGDLVDQLDKALSLAFEGFFDKAVEEFNIVMHNAYDEYGTFCHNWIEQIARYREIGKLANRPAMIQLALPKWKTFTQQYGHDFDPLGVYAKCAAYDPEMTVASRPASLAAPQYSSPNAPYAPPARPAVTSDIYAMIEQFHIAFDNQDWEKAAAILQDIRESGMRIPHVFDINGYEQDLQNELGNEERNQDYNVIRRMLQAHKPNYTRIYEAVEIFWSRYPGYDPDNIAGCTDLFAHAWYNAAQGYDPDDHTAQIGAYTEALRLRPNFAEAYIARGNCYYNIKEYALSTADFSKAILLNPLDSEAYYNRGYSYAAQDLRSMALADFKTVLQINPEHRHADGIPKLIDMLSKKRNAKRSS